MNTKEAEKKHQLLSKKKIEKNLDLSLREGAITSASSGLGFSYLSPFAILMNATSSQIGILYGITHLMPGIAQLKTPRILTKWSYKKTTLIGVISQAFLWLLIILTGVAFYFRMPGVVWLLIILSGILYFFYGTIQPAWFSWMGSLVPQKIRGRFFSKRNVIVGVFGIIATILAALFLDKIKKIGEPYNNSSLFTITGFLAIFLLTVVTTLWAANVLKKISQPKVKIRKKDYFTLFQFIKKAPETPAGDHPLLASSGDKLLFLIDILILSLLLCDGATF